MIQPYPSKPSYTDNVFTRLMTMPVGSRIDFDPAKGTADDWSRFLEATKRFIDETTDHPLIPYEIQIASDYTGIRKKARA